MPSLWNMGQDDPQDFMSALQGQRNSLVGLGLGLMSHPGMASALQGYESGARTDSADNYRRAQARQHQQELAFRQQESGRAQSNADRSFGLQREQFEATRPDKIRPGLHQEKGFDPANPDATRWIFSFPKPDAPGGMGMRYVTPEQATSMGGMGVPQIDAPDTRQNAGPETPQFAEPPPAMGAPGSTTPQQPGGQPVMNMKEYYKEKGQEQAKLDVKGAEQGQAGEKLNTLITELDKKTRHPLFKQGTGVYAGAAGGASPLIGGMFPNPARLAYEKSDTLSGGEDAKNYMGQVRSDAQAINSELQRVYLKGQGSVTEFERKQIDNILGNIEGSRSPEHAQAQLANLRKIVATTLSRPPGWQPPPGQRLWQPEPEQGAGGTSQRPPLSAFQR